jgi:hypothetical protein
MSEIPVVELDAARGMVLADALPETPETVMTVHFLRRGLARAVVAGDPAQPAAVVVQAHALPEEPTVHGDDPGAILSALSRLQGWEYINAAASVAPALAEAVKGATGYAPELIGEVYYVLDRPVVPIPHRAVRRLGPADLPLVEPEVEDLGNIGWRFGDSDTLLRDGFVAGAVVDGRLVAAAYTSAKGERYAEVGVATYEPWRGRGFAHAAAALVCADIQHAGLIPVWSTAEENGASRRVAAKLGFGEVSHRVYLNPR